MTATIDGITFTILGFPPPYEDRPIVVYTSTSNGVTNTYCAYKSITEGLWRFATTPASGIYIQGMAPRQLIKGKHYITSSQLHIRLQELINSRYNGTITHPDYNYLPILEINEARRSEIEVLLYGSGREYNSKGVFSPLDALCSPENDHCLGTFDKVERTLQTKINGQCAKMINGSFLAGCLVNPYYTTFRGILRENPPITNIDELINVINQYMQKYFMISKTSIPIFESTITDPNTGASILMVINHIQITKKSEEVFDVYIGTYRYNGKDYKIILNVVPTTAKINKYGLFSTYVSSGIYTYKMFDFIDGRYEFIGDRLTRLWPQVTADVPTGVRRRSGSISKQGGRRRRTNCRPTKLRRRLSRRKQ